MHTIYYPPCRRGYGLKNSAVIFSQIHTEVWQWSPLFQPGINLSKTFLCATLNSNYSHMNKNTIDVSSTARKLKALLFISLVILLVFSLSRLLCDHFNGSRIRKSHPAHANGMCMVTATAIDPSCHGLGVAASATGTQEITRTVPFS